MPSKSFRRIFLLVAIVPVAIFPIALPPAHAADWTVHTQPAKPVNGGPVLFQVKTPARLQSLHGTWLGHDVPFSFDPHSKTWFALAGVSLESPPGAYALELSGKTEAAPAAAAISFSKKINVVTTKYPKIPAQLSVESKFTEPTPEQQKEIAEAQQVKKDYLSRISPEREWSGQFVAPASAPLSDVFGSVRVFNNGKSSSPHLGLDFRVPSGTPVDAMNDGTVLLARPLYFEGNFIVLDHGQGLLTLYLHLSEFKVKEGETVKRGQVIGLSGGTGRATGPHLHAAVRWQGTYLDPAKLISLPLPKIGD